MADDAEMQAKIAALAGAINRHKQQQQTDSTAQPQQHYNSPVQPHRGGYHQQHNNRWAPFPSSRGRGRGGYGPAFQNRTLVNATTSATPPASPMRAPRHQQQDLQNREEALRLAQAPSVPTAIRQLEIEGVLFTIKEDGSKLTRVTGEQ